MTIKLNETWKRVFWQEALLASLKGGAVAHRAIERADAALAAYIKRMEKAEP